MSIISENGAGSSRRQFLTRAGVVGATAVGAGLMGKSGIGASSAEAAEVALFKPVAGKGFRVNDVDILNFALNLEYLEATFFNMVANGQDIPASLTGGVGGAGALASTVPQANFTSNINKMLAQELADAEIQHINDIKAVLGAQAVARPSLDLAGGFQKAYAAAVAASGLTGLPANFTDAATNDALFLMGAFTFEDVGVSAYNGASPYISSSEILAAASSILPVEGYHAGAGRIQLYQYGLENNPALLNVANAISDLRNAASNAADAKNTPTDTPMYDGQTGQPFFAAIDPANGLAWARTFTQVLNVVYLNSASPAAAGGGFYPNGMNGRLR